MAKILGLDLGVSSIGWALIEENDSLKRIIDMGVRIIPLTTDENDEFTKGNSISKNAKRTLMRTARKGLDRYQLRRKALLDFLKANNMLPDKQLLLNLSPLEIWGLRARAAREEVTLSELGRILLHLNQKRGYKHSKTEQAEDDKKQTDYVAAVNNRHDFIRSKNITIGELFYIGLKDFDSLKAEWPEIENEPVFRTREKVFPRAAYEAEFDQIWNCQKEFHSQILTDELYNRVRNEIIYYQRPLKSQKGLVSLCEFEAQVYINKEGREVEAGPKVAPRSSPLFQVCKQWESINNISVTSKKGVSFPITLAHKKEIFNFLDSHEKLNQTELFKILDIGKNEGYFTHAQIRKAGLQGNVTKAKLIQILGEDHPALRFELTNEVYEVTNTETGEIIKRERISADYENQPLYKLWHIIYSLNNDEAACVKKLCAGIKINDRVIKVNEEQAKKLAKLDFTKAGFGNKSSKAMRKILPYLKEGFVYSGASALAGYNHSNSITKEENLQRELAQFLEPIKKNSLRQPVVEKILNQLVNLVNALIEKHGNFAEIRVELARELKQSKEERNNAYNNINKRDRENKAIEAKLLAHPEFKKKSVSKRDIERYRLWEEFKYISPYEPTKVISLGELYSGNYDIEHIIPKALRFDDSFSNKTICPRKYNSGEDGKNSHTAIDYMSAKRSDADYSAYIQFIENAYKDKWISKTKYQNLLTSTLELKGGFIDRQLRETQYISRKAREILSTICHNVHSTGGGITERLRDLWGWNSVLENINLDKFRKAGQTHFVDVNHAGQTHKEERIINWSKRDDHRHHAIDALVIACTKQGFIQRINSLNAQQTRDEMFEAIKDRKDSRFSLLDNYLLQQKPFNTSEIIEKTSGIIISFKPGKKVASYSKRTIKKNGKNEVVQNRIVSPRGPLSEESVYGKIKRKITRKVKLDKNFTGIDKVVDAQIKKLLLERVSQFGNEFAKAFGNLKKEPIWLNSEKSEPLTEVEVIDYVDEFVIKYPVENIGPKDLEFVVDEGVRNVIRARLETFNNNPKEAYKDLAKNPLWLNEAKKIPLKRVRCFTGIKPGSIASIKVKDTSWDLEYEKFVKTGSNHHIAIYRNENGKLVEHVVTFWHAVERKRFGLPVVIKDTVKLWEELIDRELPQTFLDQLPNYGLEYVTSMQRNEIFVFNFSQEELQNAIANKEYHLIAQHTYRVRKLTSGKYFFNQQFETSPRESLTDKETGRCIQTALGTMTGIKVKVNAIGEVFLEDNIYSTLAENTVV